MGSIYLAKIRNSALVSNYQTNPAGMLYGIAHATENYLQKIKYYFGQSIYDQVTAGFMQQSSVYTDSLRLEEWHLYGSSRIGIYQTNKAMAQRTVRIENGVTTQVSNTHIEQLSLSRFTVERGAKRYELTNHLGNVLTVVTDKKLPVCNSTSISYFIADLVSATDYSPFGAPLAGRTWQGGEYRYGFNTQERDDEIAGFGNIMTAEYWEYDTRLGRRWNLDPKNLVGFSSYACFFNNPIINTDIKGDIPIPLKDKFKQWTWRIDSWFGPRNTGIKGASKFHKGLDFNYRGGGATDYGAPILATHKGTAKVDNNTQGQEGRQVIITSPDGSFRTIYMHLSNVIVKDGAQVGEADVIGEMGGSANGSERGREVHLHYSIQKFNTKTGKWEAYDPTEGKGKSRENIVDPQKWIKTETLPTPGGGFIEEIKYWFKDLFQKKSDYQDYIPTNPKTENKV